MIEKLLTRLTLDLTRVSRHLRVTTDTSLVSRVKKFLHSRNFTSLKEMLFLLVCVIGCLVHMPFAVISYMRYPTILRTSESLELLRDYSLTFCIDWREFFDATQVNKLRVSDVFATTPSETDMIRECAYWGLHDKVINNLTHISDRILFTQSNASICNRLYRVKKFFRFNYMCYMVDQVKKLEWTRNQMNNVIEDQKLLYMLSYANTSLTGMYRVVVTPRGGNNYPLASLRWSPHLTRHSENVWYRVTYQSFHVMPLPPPYSDGGYTNMLRFYCIEDCITQALAEHRINFSQFYTQSPNGTLVPSLVDVNVTFNRLLKSKELLCRHTCLQSDRWKTDYQSYYYTHTDVGYVYEDIRKFPPRDYSTAAFYLYSTDRPVVEMEYRKKLSFFELIIFMGNILSIWFGVSVLSMNPFIKRQHLSLHQLVHLRHQLEELNKLVRDRSKSVAATR